MTATASRADSADDDMQELAEEVQNRTDDVARALQELGSLLLSEESLDTTLQRVAELAKATIPGCDAAGVTLSDRDGYVSVAWTDGRTLAIDQEQYARDHGPCLEAMREQQIVRTSIEGARDSWPDFAASAEAEGIRSFLAAPLALNGQGIGALNLYSRQPDGFERLDDALVAMYAGQATVALANARVYAQAVTLSHQLEQALASRAPIEQAKGILIARHGCTPDEAFDRLRRLSQERNVKLRDVAADVVAREQREGSGNIAPPARSPLR